MIEILLSVYYINHVTSSLTNSLFYFTNFLYQSIDYCFISHIAKLRLSTFFKIKNMMMMMTTTNI